MKILVTGGAGFIGSHTVVELCSVGYEPIIIDDLSNTRISVVTNLEKITGSKIEFHKGKFQDERLLNKIFRNSKIDGVIHFAAFKAVGESVREPLKYYNNNVAGLITLLSSMEKHGIDNLIFSSSCTVYGEPDKLPVTEKAPLKPAESPYGATKQICETIIKDTAKASKNLRALALRYFNPIGAHSSALIGELPLGIPANLVPFITQTAAGLREEITVYGNDYPTPDGTCIRDYIHVVDLARAHIKALKHSSSQKYGYNEFINIGTGKGSSVMEVIDTFQKVSGRKLKYKIGPRRPGDVVSTFADASKAKRILGWNAEKSLGDALADAWHWQQSLAKMV